MKTRILYIICCFAMLLISACKKHDFADGTLSPIIAVSDLRALYKGSDVPLTDKNMQGATEIVGIVISNPDSGNVPKDVVVLQNIRRSATRGINLALGSSSTSYHSGDSLIVNVNGAVLKRVNGALQIAGLTAGNITKVSANNAVTVRTASSYTIKANPDQYESTLVKITAATVIPVPKFGDTYAGEKYLVNGADSIVLHTEATASYANNAIPASATFTGVLFQSLNAAGKTIFQVWPRSGADVTDIVKPVDPDGSLGPNPVIVTGYVNDSKGADGNYEYFQFRATQNIDFSKTPMAVVTCTNAGTAAPNAGDAPGAGWATGGGRTYKFNLTSGKVNQGDFFYVGGSNKKIDGPNTTDISSANWIRTIAYVTTDGDGFGSASTGLLPNSGNAGGIAIFVGTNVTNTSVPVDFVLFGGTGVTTIYNATTGKGYLAVDNDHYHLKDPTTGVDQPFIFQGSNSYVIPHSTPADAGIFVKLGGTFNMTSKIWTKARGYTFLTMSPTSALTDIETGTDVTSVTK
ncbi:DUF5689 domain-containing protein [Mucilaginibacter jinjuensis]|uniref:DUF5689 domain-containing protein n=1 Tax=Mucilaginibacter jinjuensis TaxID=1176721 RepID=A0ABY7T161_9SPHI|nr:DUF5689 domain-containing protein [Mucilaginibacter jinjuensis]WCT10169.1 DUF5689 domain-containing protein [Mucilaginibacter jinjuensis]